MGTSPEQEKKFITARVVNPPPNPFTPQNLPPKIVQRREYNAKWAAVRAAIDAEPDKSKWPGLPEVQANPSIFEKIIDDRKRQMTEWPIMSLPEEKVTRAREVRKYAKSRDITIENALIELINKGLSHL